jgi:hypothetical protein
LHKGISNYYLDNDVESIIKLLRSALNFKDSIQAIEQDIQIINIIGKIYGEKED